MTVSLNKSTISLNKSSSSGQSLQDMIHHLGNPFTAKAVVDVLERHPKLMETHFPLYLKAKARLERNVGFFKLGKALGRTTAWCVQASQTTLRGVGALFKNSGLRKQFELKVLAPLAKKYGYLNLVEQAAFLSSARMQGYALGAQQGYEAGHEVGLASGLQLGRDMSAAEVREKVRTELLADLQDLPAPGAPIPVLLRASDGRFEVIANGELVNLALTREAQVLVKEVVTDRQWVVWTAENGALVGSCSPRLIAKLQQGMQVIQQAANPSGVAVSSTL
ncbi:FliH/SctL family protein [Parachitinimonas caeni]|uniref:Uncharacterized protein n=1 Tax=Parachitinimonas caeni TaxID=3031301 RepID=A0ABT7E376_9NEIS|nr:hypothetical protein [Parachitinimonas caeni]MDK2126755.1 hypothetical protein [Parachitinimonas caeni]